MSPHLVADLLANLKLLERYINGDLIVDKAIVLDHLRAAIAQAESA